MYLLSHFTNFLELKQKSIDYSSVTRKNLTLNRNTKYETK